MPNRNSRIAVIAPNWLGDAVMSLPLIGFLGASGATISLVAPPYTARVFSGIPGVDDLVVTSSRGRIRRIQETVRALRSIRPGAIVVLPPSFSSAFAARLGAAKARVGFDTDARSCLLTDSLPDTRSTHLSESYVAIGARAIERMGLSPAMEFSTPGISIQEDDHAEVAGLLDRFGIAGPYAVVVPGAAYGPAKSWPAERFNALVARLAADTPVVLTGAPKERDLCERVASGVPGVHNAASRTSIGGFFALLRRAAVVVANDSGSPHAAASLGAPVVVLFGSTSPTWTAPIGSRVQVLQHVVHCNPCFRRECPTELECFSGIEVDTVAAAARSLCQSDGAQKEVASDRH